MNDILFTCTMTAEQLASQKKFNWLAGYVILPLCLLVLFGVTVFIILIPFTVGIDEELKDAYFLFAIILLFVLLLLFICVYLAIFIIEFPRMNKEMFDIIADKQFSYNFSTNRLTYKDPKRTFTFAGTDVVKWVSVMAKGASTDILRLQNGEQIVLESKFNPDVHSFLHEYRHVLQLPAPERTTMVINYYRNPV